MKAHLIEEILAQVHAAPVSTAEEDAAAFPQLAAFNEGALYVGKFAGQSPWEIHPDADELLHVLAGEVQVTLLTVAGERTLRMSSGSVLVVPRGLWHRQLALPSVSLLAITPNNSRTSFAADPRLE